MKFKMLTAIERVGEIGHGTYWRCRCDCGNVTVVSRGELTSNSGTKSCGCWNRETARRRRMSHGGSYLPEYSSWANMWSRCTNVNNKMHHRYGGRGITVCRRWRKFETFLEDMGRRPSGGYSLERKNNDGNYEPQNCVWTTRAMQNRNQSRLHFVEYGGQRMPLSAAVEASNSPADYQCVRARLKRGWDLARALAAPSHPNYRAALLRRHGKKMRT